MAVTIAPGGSSKKTTGTPTASSGSGGYSKPAATTASAGAGYRSNYSSPQSLQEEQSWADRQLYEKQLAAQKTGNTNSGSNSGNYNAYTAPAAPAIAVRLR